MTMYKVDLTLEELKLLDGKVSEEVQRVIDRAKKEERYGFELPFMNRVLREAEERGKLTWSRVRIRHCPFCDKRYDYHRYTRDTKHHRKGEINPNRPVWYSGLAFNLGFIHIEGTGDICTDCARKHRVIERLIDYILDHDLKVEIQKNDYRHTRYIRDEIVRCFNCKREVQRSKMGKLPALFGGEYRGKCPFCGAEERFLGETHEPTGRWVMTDAERA